MYQNTFVSSMIIINIFYLNNSYAMENTDHHSNTMSHNSAHNTQMMQKGVYEFDWAPQKANANYKIWAELFPLASNA